MHLDPEIVTILESEDNNLLQVRSYTVFRAPKYSDDIYVSLNVVHAHSGLRYMQMIQIPTTIAKALGRILQTNGELGHPSHPDF